MKDIKYSVDEPIPFSGSDEEKTANTQTHYFTAGSDRCAKCDCKVWHKAFEYECGTEPPRQIVDYLFDGTANYYPTTDY